MPGLRRLGSLPLQRLPKLRGIALDSIRKMTLGQLVSWVAEVPGSLPFEMRPMAEAICESFSVGSKTADGFGAGLPEP